MQSEEICKYRIQKYSDKNNASLGVSCVTKFIVFVIVLCNFVIYIYYS